LLNDVSQRYNVRIAEKHIGDTGPVQVFDKRRHTIPILHNIGFSPNRRAEFRVGQFVELRLTMHQRPSRCWILGIGGFAGKDLPGTHDKPFRSVSDEVKGVASNQRQRLFIAQRGEKADFSRIDDSEPGYTVHVLAVECGQRDLVVSPHVFQLAEQSIPVGGYADVTRLAGSAVDVTCPAATLSVSLSTPSLTIAESPNRGIAITPMNDGAAARGLLCT
jgi:hypothetical protein